MEQSQIERAAALLWRTRLEQRRIDALPDDLRPRSLAEGYAIQDAMVAAATQPVAGWKIAATSKAGQEHIGVTEPLAGRLFENFVLEDGAPLPAAPLHMKVMEAEFAFRMGCDLPPRSAAAYEQTEVCDAVAALHLAIEVPDARFERFAEIGPAQIVADDAFASWFLLGPEVRDWRRLDLASQRVRALKKWRACCRRYRRQRPGRPAHRADVACQSPGAARHRPEGRRHCHDRHLHHAAGGRGG